MTGYNVYANIMGQTTDEKELVAEFGTRAAAVSFAQDQQTAMNPEAADGLPNFFVLRAK